MQKFNQVKFRKDRVKIQIWGKPVVFFSCAMSVHNEIWVSAEEVGTYHVTFIADI